ncbi:TPA_asm: hypothetical protein GIN74_11335 [Listeria monocytogenes]|nr:hypothetical protein LMxysn_2475 [Listeria monocytogenes]HAB0009983.1 hypothetical protein [Listeria monocytogenes]
MQDIHATKNDSSPIGSDFETVADTSIPDDYLVTLTASNSFGTATRQITVHVLSELELKVPDSFRMDIDANIDAVPILDQTQTLHSYGTGAEPKVSITDRRTPEVGWTPSSSASTFQNTTGDILEASLSYQSDTLSSAVLLNSTNQPVEKMLPAGTAGYDTTTISLQDSLSMEIKSNDSLVGSAYTSTIKWTLEDVPQP